MPGFQLLQKLPSELRQDILSRLLVSDLDKLNLVSKWCYDVATPWIWREVELLDCRTEHVDGVDEFVDELDEHDDTPIIRKLILMVNKPWLASCVHVLTHRCRLPSPSIFNELPHVPFSAQTLSVDPRTIRLMQLAVAHMKNVHTLRIILGHPNLTDTLLRCFFDVKRYEPGSGCVRIRRLWLENCRISAGLNTALQDHPYGLPLNSAFSGLETVRFRRLPMKPGLSSDSSVTGSSWNYGRGGMRRWLQDGIGDRYITTTWSLRDEIRAGEDHLSWNASQRTHPDQPSPLEWLFKSVHYFDDKIYERLAHTVEIPAEVLKLGSASFYERSQQAYRGGSLNPEALMEQPVSLEWKRMQREKIPSSDAAISLLRSASASLTSINLDWVLTIPSPLGWSRDNDLLAAWVDIFTNLFDCRFPHLRAFQLRNCVVPDTLLPRGLCLLDRSYPRLPGEEETSELLASSHEESAPASELAALKFLEAHPNIRCLAWPMDHFFAPIQTSHPDVAKRIDEVIDTLGRTLTDLRVDALFLDTGETMTAEDDIFHRVATLSRRRFISHFAARMTKVESIKIEGGVPRDERREIVRALHACPLKKIVMIGVCSPLGNTWGENGEDIRLLTPISSGYTEGLEGEDTAATHELGLQDPSPPGPDFKFEPEYQWQGKPPMLHVLASYHADSVRELKFCGYKGSSVLFTPTPLTRPILSALRHFHNLNSIIMSMWLTTHFESDAQDAEIIKYWTSMRTPTSTALVHITDDEPEGWEKELRTKYAPDALAWRITNFIGPYLSEQAKARKGGVHVRASFCIGAWNGIFDVDLHVGKGALNSDICLGFTGPREEMETERRMSKLEKRRWF